MTDLLKQITECHALIKAMADEEFNRRNVLMDKCCPVKCEIDHLNSYSSGLEDAAKMLKKVIEEQEAE